MSSLISDKKPKLRWLVADLNSYFASCEQQEEPSLRGKPVAVAPLIVDTTCAIAAARTTNLRRGDNVDVQNCISIDDAAEKWNVSRRAGDSSGPQETIRLQEQSISGRGRNGP